MMTNTTYEIVNTVAKQYVPNKKHPYLHVNSREAWIDLVVELINKGSMKPKLSVILKFALNWELLLTAKYIHLN